MELLVKCVCMRVRACACVLECFSVAAVPVTNIIYLESDDECLSHVFTPFSNIKPFFDNW